MLDDGKFFQDRDGPGCHLPYFGLITSAKFVIVGDEEQRPITALDFCGYEGASGFDLLKAATIRRVIVHTRYAFDHDADKDGT